MNTELNMITAAYINNHKNEIYAEAYEVSFAATEKFFDSVLNAMLKNEGVIGMREFIAEKVVHAYGKAAKVWFEINEEKNVLESVLAKSEKEGKKGKI